MQNSQHAKLVLWSRPLHCNTRIINKWSAVEFNPFAYWATHPLHLIQWTRRRRKVEEMANRGKVSHSMSLCVTLVLEIMFKTFNGGVFLSVTVTQQILPISSSSVLFLIKLPFFWASVDIPLGILGSKKSTNRQMTHCCCRCLRRWNLNSIRRISFPISLSSLQIVFSLSSFYSNMFAHPLVSRGFRWTKACWHT